MPRERTELSRKNKYWIPKYRYLELKNFCLQYHELRQELEEIRQSIGAKAIRYDNSNVKNGSGSGDPTAAAAERMAEIGEKIKLIEMTAGETDADLSKYILLSVTAGVPYWQLEQRYDIPCSKRTFARYRRRFFWLLSRKK